MPRVQFDAAQVGHVDERGLVLAEQPVDVLVVRLGMDLLRLDPGWVILQVFLIKAVSVDSVRMPVQRSSIIRLGGEGT